MNKGFTLVELLVVMAIIGIIGGLGVTNFIGARDRARVGEVTSQLAADLERARSSARRTNQAASVIWATSGLEYSLVVNGQTIKRTMPSGVTVTLPSVKTIEYSAPFGEVTTATNVSFTITRTGKTTISESVKVLGVTGKVYRQ